MAAGWYPDPFGRHEHRYWDGGAWTEHAADRGVTAEDPPGDAQPTPVASVAAPAAPPPAPAAATPGSAPPTVASPAPAPGAPPPPVGAAPPGAGGPRTAVVAGPRRAGFGTTLTHVAAILLIVLGTIQAVAVGTVGSRGQSTPFGDTDGFADLFALARTNSSSSTPSGEFSMWVVSYAGMGLVVLGALVAILVLVPRPVRSLRRRVKYGDASALGAETAAAGAGPEVHFRSLFKASSYRGRWIALLVLWLVVIAFTIYPITDLAGHDFSIRPGGFVALALGVSGLVAALLLTPPRRAHKLLVDPMGHMYPSGA